MILYEGDMLAQPCDVLLFTANAAVTHMGKLVMGRGAALAVRDRYPDVDRVLGGWIQRRGDPYGIAWFSPLVGALTIGAFQVKHHWQDAADLRLIASSADILWRLALQHWQRKKISLNFPGIGNGRLRRSDVLPLLERLPDNVSVWELK